MINGLWGKKIGMTQVFSDDNKVVPVTAIDLSSWYVAQIKTKEKDSYTAIKFACIKEKFVNQEFSADWLKEPKKYFCAFKEVRSEEISSDIVVGKRADSSVFEQGAYVDVFGQSKGAGFQGVVKRHGFAGGRASHGATFGRFTGSLSFMRSRGRVIKGKKMPGRMGMERCVIKNLEIIRIESSANVVFVKGSVPGRSGSLVFVRKCR